MPPWIWPGQSYQARSLPLDAQRLVNMFTEPSPKEAKSQVPIYMSPGLSLFAAAGTGPIRGMHVMSDADPAVGELLYIISGNQLFSVNESGTATLLRTTNLGGVVRMADNGTQLVMVDGSAGWIYQPLGLTLITTETVNPTAPLSVGAQKTTSWTSATTIGTIAFTTTAANSLVVLHLSTENGGGTSPSVASVTDTQSLTWHRRASATNTAITNEEVEVWWAVVPTESATTITVTYAASVRTAVLRAVEVHGANTTTPWDTNASLPAIADGTATSNQVTGVTTTATNTLLMGFLSSAVNVSPYASAGQGWTAIGQTAVGSAGEVFNGVAYQALSGQVYNSAQNAWVGSASGGYSTSSINIIDAIQAAPQNQVSVILTGSVSEGDTIVFDLDNGTQFTTTISAAPTGPVDDTLLTLAAPFPSTMTSGAVAVVASNTLGQILQPGFSAAATVVYFDGYFIFNATNTVQFFLSALYNGTQYSTLDYASATAGSYFILAVVNYHEQLMLFTTKTVEVWYDSGALAFPFARYDGAFIQRGLGSAYGVVQEDNTLLWLGEDNIFYRLEGYTPLRVSTFATEHAWAQYPTTMDLQAYVITIEGHKFVFLNFIAGLATWCYDISAGVDPPLWHERISYGTPWIQTGLVEETPVTIYSMFSEDITYVYSVNYAYVTTPYFFRSNFARYGMVARNAGYLRHVLMSGPQSSFNLHVQAQGYQTEPVTFDGNTVMSFVDASEITRIVCIGNSGLGTFNVYTQNAALTKVLLGTSTGGLVWNANGITSPIDVALVYSASGSITIRFNGQVIFTYSGNLLTDAATQIATVYLGCGNNNYPQNGIVWSEGLVSDISTSLLGAGNLTETPYAVGNTQQFTGVGGGSALVTNINPEVINDANYNYTGSAAEISEWQVDTAVPTGYQIAAVGIVARLQVGTTGPQNAKMYLRVNSVDNASPNVSPAPGTTFGIPPVGYIWQENPNTAAPFVLSDIALASNAFNIGVASET